MLKNLGLATTGLAATATLLLDTTAAADLERNCLNCNSKRADRSKRIGNLIGRIHESAV